MTRSSLPTLALAASVVFVPLAGATAAETSAPTDAAVSEDRAAPNQRPDELAETTILNSLIAHGYAAVGPLRREGDFYYVDVESTTHEPQTLRIDPHTRAITRIR